jgi:putative membrane protein
LTVVAYCGLPPSPAEIWTRWRLDPVVLSLLFAWLGIYLVGARALRRKARPLTTREIALFCAGWAIATLALVSPLCPLSVSLFSARATQHVVLTLLAAPLVVAGRALDAAVAACLIDYSGRTWPERIATVPMRAAAAFAVLLWLWHSPPAYAATFESTSLYWTMHVTLFASACWLWSTLFRRESALVGGLLAGIASSVQMGLLGALITLSPRAFYAPHFLTTDAWGMTPLQDQQLGGVIMWVPGCTVFLVVATIALGRCLARGRADSVRVSSPGTAQ